MSVFLFLIHILCFMSFGFTFVCIWRVDSTLYLFIVFKIHFLFHFYFTFMLEPPQWSRHHILCMSPHSVCPLWPLLPSLRPCPSLQHWDQGGGNSEEPERLIACTWLQAGPQSALLSAPSGPEPKPAHRLGVPQRSLPAGQTPLQLSRRPPFPCFFLSFPRSG